MSRPKWRARIRVMPGAGFIMAGRLPQTSRSVLTLSAATVTYGHERRERIMVTVSPQRSGTPTGTVTVRVRGNYLPAGTA